MNAVIVYEKMGMGHLRMARIISDALEARGHQTHIVPGSELVDDSSVYLINHIWNLFIKENWIRSVDLLLNFLARTIVLPTYETIYYRRFSRRLEQLKPDIVISTADAYNKSLGEYAEEKGIPFFIFITDCSIFYDLAFPTAIHLCYFPETAQAIRALNFETTYYSSRVRTISGAREGWLYVLRCWRDMLTGAQAVFKNVDASPPTRNSACIRIVGPMTPPQYYEQYDTAAVRAELSIPNNCNVVLVASGSIGGKMVSSISQRLCRTYSEPLTILAMCGKDQKLLTRLRAFGSPNPSVRLRPYGYRDDFGRFLAASDCVIARPSASLFTEAIRYCVPPIAIGPVPSNDKGTAVLIQRYQVGEFCEHPRHIAPVLRKVLDNKEHYRAHLRALQANGCRSYAEQLKRLGDIILGAGSG